MPSAAVDVAFKTRLRDHWTVSVVADGLGMNDPQNLTDVPPGADAFLVVQYPVVNRNRPALQPHYVEDGAARLVLNTKLGLGSTTTLAWTDTLIGLFNSLSSQDFSGVETFVPNGPAINDASDDGNWIAYSIIVPYRYQFNDA
jgi:hypothetical protein